MTSQAARDLLWAINSPSLIAASSLNYFDWPILQAGDFDAAVVQEFCDQKSRHRVGQYFEDLVHIYLETVRSFELVEHGLQIQEKGRTVGELDFLYRDADGLLHHCETAVKFYLYVRESNDSGSHLIGPNAADNFERKSRRLLEHQLRLSEDRFPDVSRREAFVKGRIFYHPLDAPPKALPELLAKDHLKGMWIRESELELLSLIGPEAKFRIARKPYWLAPDQAAANDADLQSCDAICGQLSEHFRMSKMSRLINVLSEDGTCWQESHRVFVVSDQWPEEAG